MKSRLVKFRMSTPRVRNATALPRSDMDALDDDDGGECAVCLQPTIHRLYPCNHAVCSLCEREWRRRSHSCPLCRGLVICTDTQIAKTPRDRTRYANLILQVDFPLGSFAGITLQDSAWFPRLVYIKHLCAIDRAASCGLKRGDYLLTIDDIPVSSHEVGVRLMEHASQAQQTIRVHVRRFRWRTKTASRDAEVLEGSSTAPLLSAVTTRV